MKVIVNDFELETDTWDDPGDYPSGAGQFAQESYDYISGVLGELVVELEDGNIDEGCDVEEQLREHAHELADLPSGILVSKWEVTRGDGGRVTFSVTDFEQQ